MEEMIMDTAYLSFEKEYVVFAYLDRRIRFRSPKGLIGFENIVDWDNGYLAVNAKYAHFDGFVEDYIDLIPILDDLYIDSKAFLEPIKKVELINN